MNTSRNQIVNFNSSINLAKEHETNLKNEALNMQLKIMGQNLNLNERVSDLYNYCAFGFYPFSLFIYKKMIIS